MQLSRDNYLIYRSLPAWCGMLLRYDELGREGETNLQVNMLQTLQRVLR